MIVLDEQLLGRGIEHDIARWYRGTVQFITNIRPNTVIKDDAIPMLLRHLSQPAFVTINSHDFWQRVPGDPRYCMVCFALSDAQATDIPQALRVLFRQTECRTKARRMGKIIRITSAEISFYTDQTRQTTTLELEGR